MVYGKKNLSRASLVNAQGSIVTSTFVEMKALPLKSTATLRICSTSGCTVEIAGMFLAYRREAVAVQTAAR